jgi:hypothetical protein
MAAGRRSPTLHELYSSGLPCQVIHKSTCTWCSMVLRNRAASVHQNVAVRNDSRANFHVVSPTQCLTQLCNFQFLSDGPLVQLRTALAMNSGSEIFLQSMYDENMFFPIDLGRNSKPFFLGRGAYFARFALLLLARSKHSNMRYEVFTTATEVFAGQAGREEVFNVERRADQFRNTTSMHCCSFLRINSRYFLRASYC